MTRNLPFFLLVLLSLPLVACGTRGGGGGGGGDDDDSAVDDDDATPDDDDATPDDDDATPGDDDDTPGDDDDTPGDDDDTPPPDDDDVTAGDDDDTPPPTDPCNGSTVTDSDDEPNNDLAEPQIVSTNNGDVIITGSMSECANDGNTWTGDTDAFLLELDCADNATINLTWPGTDVDLDLQVLDEAGGQLGTGYQFSTVPPETVTTATSGPILVNVLCWEGSPPADYTLEITF